MRYIFALNRHQTQLCLIQIEMKQFLKNLKTELYKTTAMKTTKSLVLNM